MICFTGHLSYLWSRYDWYDFDVWLQLHTTVWQTSLQQELEDSVAQKMEEFEQVKSALQQKEEEIVSQQQTLQEKDGVIAGLNMTLDEKVKELENVSKELIVEKEKSQVTTFCLFQELHYTWINRLHRGDIVIGV